MFRTLLAGLLLVTAAATPAFAAPSKEELAAASAAETRGAALYAYDQAAWHASDAFQADVRKQKLSVEKLHGQGLRGYVVEPDGDLLLVTFFQEIKDGKQAFARYWVRGSEVIRGGIVADSDDRTLSPLALRLIEARALAISQAIKDKAGLCSRSSPNFVILPPGNDGIVSAYILTSTTEVGVYPAGGHYRYDFDAKGQLVAKRQFMKSCFPVDFGEKNGQKPIYLMLTHLLDRQPTEIHVFVSYNIPIALHVTTMDNKETWEVSRGKIRPAKGL